MAATILNSNRAIEVSVFIVRAFVKIRSMIAEHKELARKISLFERRLTAHDHQILSLVEAVKKIINPEKPHKKRRLGF